MTNFKVGDRVRVYYSYGPKDGTIASINNNGDLMVKMDQDDSSPWRAHPKQCRKLRIRKRTEWWVNVQQWKLIGSNLCSYKRPEDTHGWICLVEKKIKK